MTKDGTRIPPVVHRALLLAGACLAILSGCEHIPWPRGSPERPPLRNAHPFTATAYTLPGLTAAGVPARRGLCAADPRVLPIGTRILVHDAGPYSGEYVVADTGPEIDGYEIDIYMDSRADALSFGRRRVRVEVLRYGED